LGSVSGLQARIKLRVFCDVLNHVLVRQVGVAVWKKFMPPFSNPKKETTGFSGSPIRSNAITEHH